MSFDRSLDPVGLDTSLLPVCVSIKVIPFSVSVFRRRFLFSPSAWISDSGTA
jgi:hypothetical protein